MSQYNAPLTFQQAEESFRKYPYFVLPALRALPSADPEQRTILLRRIAALIGSETALRTLLGIDPEEFAEFYPDMKAPELSTDDTISSFISRFSSEDAAETPEIESIVTAPVIDYAAMLEAEDENPESSVRGENDSTSDVISDFLAAVPVKKPKKRTIIPRSSNQEKVEDEKKTQEKPQLSEELFKIMVKNRNYRKALEIITELSLNNPKKSIYFADQIRFLKKLIQNQEYSAKK